MKKAKTFIDQYDGEEIDFPSGPKDWKKFEQNNKTTALNILFLPYNTKQITLAYKSKHNVKHEIEVIFLMITDGKKMALSCREKFICIIWRNNIRSCWRLLLFKLVSFIQHKKIFKKPKVYAMIMITVMQKCLTKTTKY